MEWDGTTHGQASVTNEAGGACLIGWPVHSMKWEICDMDGDSATHGWYRTTNDTGWDIPLASVTNEAGWHTSWAGPSIMGNETVQLMDRLGKEMMFSSTTYGLAHPQYGVGWCNPWMGQWDK
ncbi:hypothetical protein EDD16DRAFT_1520241 [Pisolithus croceorrhizus]|nr:hypothetical protein EDD16DRAFT_1520241 [Pisolithus croceorrhizus]KAI6156283.1 hypothetical protein EDD17DRAFT_1512604 [Pisolithus thermaeus]